MMLDRCLYSGKSYFLSLMINFFFVFALRQSGTTVVVCILSTQEPLSADIAIT